MQRETASDVKRCAAVVLALLCGACCSLRNFCLCNVVPHGTTTVHAQKQQKNKIGRSEEETGQVVCTHRRPSVARVLPVSKTSTLGVGTVATDSDMRFRVRL